MYDIIVVGAGHAGVEAALAASRLGKSVLVVTTRVDRIAYMSCNPSIGGLAKGHIVKEIDILGGSMGQVTDKSTLQFKRLNARKGPAVRGSRAQCDKDVYSSKMSSVLKKESNIKILEAEAKSLVLQKSQASSSCKGVVLEDGSSIESKKVIITAGTFLRGVMHIGNETIEGGRVGDKASVGLSDQLRDHGFDVIRLKTGTPPRLDKNSINWSKTEPQYGDKRFIPFSYKSAKQFCLPQIACYLSHTNEKTHEVIRKNLDQSPLFSGQIEGHGPRYCPSIEDKITRFSEKLSHQTFLEQEGLNTNMIYLQGISTSLPQKVQQEFLETIPGLENVKILRPGYAVEYDCIEPTQIHMTLETRPIENLYLAGQINGTSGYEEAAGQGLWAGVNASLSIDEAEPFILGRDEAYLGVLVDDLVTKGTKEPYRMFTSRAEHRLVLREDNALERLYSHSKRLGLLTDEYGLQLESLLKSREDLKSRLSNFSLKPNQATNDKIEALKSKRLLKPSSLSEFLRRVEVEYADVRSFDEDLTEDYDIYSAVEIGIKYEGYIKRQNELIRIAKKMDAMKIPVSMDYSNVRGLSNEEVEKLSSIRPISIGQAQRVSGVNPSAIQSLLIHLKMHKKKDDTKKYGKHQRPIQAR